MVTLSRQLTDIESAPCHAAKGLKTSNAGVSLHNVDRPDAGSQARHCSTDDQHIAMQG